MEFAEAGVSDWPQMDSSAPVASSSSRQPDSSNFADDPETRRRAREEKRQRKDERAKKRAAKEVRRLDREKRMSGAGNSSLSLGLEMAEEGEEAEKGVVIPSSGRSVTDGTHKDQGEFAVSISPDRGPDITETKSKTPQSLNGVLEDTLNSISPPSPPPRSLEPVKRPHLSKSSLVVELPSTPRRQDVIRYGRSSSTKRPQPTATQDDSLSSPSSSSDASVPKAKPSKRFRPSDNAEAGPSTSKTITTANPASTSTGETTKAKRQRKRSSVAGSGSVKEEDSWPFSQKGMKDDEDVRARLSNPTAMNEFLAAKFWPVPYINRLEEAGILTVKKGKLSNEEIKAVRRHLDIFKTSYRMSDESLVDVIMAKGKGNVRESYPDFWHDVAMEIPGRPLRYVVKQVQRMYDPRGRKGPWTTHEDRELIRAHDLYAGSWLKIATVVDRTEQDCRDRWHKEIANAEKRNTGAWTEFEESELTEAIKSANLAIGSDPLSSDIPWDVVSAKIGHQRGPTQCRHKWNRDLLPREKGIMSSAIRKPKPTTPLPRGSSRPPKSAQSTPRKPKTPKESKRIKKSPKQPEKVYKSAEIYESDSEGEEEIDVDHTPEEKGGGSDVEDVEEIEDIDDEKETA